MLALARMGVAETLNVGARKFYLIDDGASREWMPSTRSQKMATSCCLLCTQLAMHSACSKLPLSDLHMGNCNGEKDWMYRYSKAGSRTSVLQQYSK